jgi:hypothetical protein
MEGPSLTGEISTNQSAHLTYHDQLTLSSFRRCLILRPPWRIPMDEAKAEAIVMVKEARRIALRLHTMGVPYQDEAAALYRIAEYIERVMGVTP